MNLLKLIPTQGTCDVCGGKTLTRAGTETDAVTTLLTHRDPPTGLQVGKCCEGHMATANRAVEGAMMMGGPCHPQPGQFSSSGN